MWEHMARAVMEVHFPHQPLAKHSAMTPLNFHEMHLFQDLKVPCPLFLWQTRHFPGHNLSPEQRVFNYRLSQAGRMMECAFIILVSQWRLYRRGLGVSPKVEVMVKATYILRNLFVNSFQEFSLVVCQPSSVLCSLLTTSSTLSVGVGLNRSGGGGGGVVDVNIAGVEVDITGVNDTDVDAIDVDVDCCVGDNEGSSKVPVSRSSS